MAHLLFVDFVLGRTQRSAATRCSANPDEYDHVAAATVYDVW